jgi:UDP-GlcNAc:undecaprenyl-phosphate GlcNAc-1-phosphate transferase
MLLLGVIDDKLDIPASKKLFFQILIALTLIISNNCTINNLGTPLGFSSPLELGLLSIPFTLFATVGLTNAFNMIDGCDGLGSSLTITSLLALLIFDTAGLNDDNNFFLLILVSNLIVFLFFNFSNNKNIKIFLGDGGSLFLGFVVAVYLIKFVDKNTLYDPSIVLWFNAVIIFDFCSVILRRKLLKRKIMAPDRNHIHHILLDLGLSHFHTTTIISLVAVVVLLFGVIVTINYPSLSLWSFFTLFTLYYSFRIFIRKLGGN